MRRYLRHFRQVRGTIVALALALSVLGLLPAAAVLALQRALDALVEGGPMAPWLLVLAGIAVVRAAGTLARARITRTLSWSLVHGLRSRVHEHFQALPVQEPVGERLSAIGHEADELQYGVSALVTCVRAPVSVISLVAAAAWIAPGLWLRFLLLLPVVGLAALVTGRWVRSATEAWRVARSDWLVELTDQHSGLRTTQDLGAAELQGHRASLASQRESRARAHLDWVRATPNALVEALVMLAVVALLAWGRGEVVAGHTTTGGLVAFAVAVGLLRRPLAQLAEVYGLAQRSIQALSRVEQVLERPIPVRAASGVGFRLEGEVAGRFRGQVRIDEGEKVAVVGASGAGKSTLLSALAGLLPVEGELERSSAQLLRQDPWVFDRTVRENLVLGCPDAAEEAVRAVLQQVELTGLADRLDERVGERGDALSGGERQRLCLARALLHGQGALLLDEATSELDPARAERIARHLVDRRGTVVFATHDPWFAPLAHRVIWLEHGTVAGVGSHAELLVHPGYAAFFRLAA